MKRAAVALLALLLPSWASASDLDSSSASNLVCATSPCVSLAEGGTGSDMSATGGTGHVLKQASVGANIVTGLIATNNFSGGAVDAAAIGANAVGRSELTETPTTPAIAAVTDTFTCSGFSIQFTTFAGTNVMTSDPTVADGTSGDICLITNIDGTGTDCITFPDGTTGLQLGAARTLCPNDILVLYYNGTDWLEVAFSNL